MALQRDAEMKYDNMVTSLYGTCGPFSAAEGKECNITLTDDKVSFFILIIYRMLWQKQFDKKENILPWYFPNLNIQNTLLNFLHAFVYYI